MLRLPSMSFPHMGARGLLRGADRFLSKELKSVRSATVSLSAFTFGLIQGKFKPQGGLTLMGLPVDLLAGAACHAFGMFSRNYSQHLHAVGDGALASFFTTTGYRVGERWGAGGSLMRGLTGMFGDVGAEPAGGGTLADQQLSNMVRAGK
jgi:hypothetical protein